jgi:hypothetical protein
MGSLWVICLGCLLFGGVDSARGGFQYRLDDGAADTLVGLTAPGGDLIWLNRFDPVPPFTLIRSIAVAFGGVPNGRPVTVALWADPNQDGNPSDAVLLATAAGVVANSNTNAFKVYDIPLTSVSGTFFVGAMVTDFAPGGNPEFPARLDWSAPVPNRSWVAFNWIGTGNLANLSANLSPPRTVEQALGFGGNWLVRADAVAVPGPSAVVLLGLGALGVLGYGWRRRERVA